MKSTILKSSLYLFALPFLLGNALCINAQTPNSWSIALADTIMKRNTGASGESLTKWSYWKGYTLNGIEMLYESTGNPRYLDYIKNQIDPFIDNDGNLVNVRLSSLDNVMAGNIVVGLYEKTHDPRYRTAADVIRKRFDTFPRNPDGGFWHNPKLTGEMWSDGVFMGQMFLIRYGESIGDRKYCYDEAIRQIMIFAKHAQKSDSGLLYHAWAAQPELALVVPERKQHWADMQTGLSPQVWSEGLGWYALVTVETLSHLPRGYPGRSEVLDIYKRLAEGLRRAQDPKSGGWSFVVDKQTKPGNWIDTSGSAMFTYALERGIELGILSRKQYAPVVANGYRAITHNARINANGTIDVLSACDGLCVQASYEDYINCNRRENAKEAIGGFLWATAIVEKPGSNKSPSLNGPIAPAH
jgi:rhamnogalacturonyl hydrolase YesR